MKKILFSYLFLFIGILCYAQVNPPIDFESAITLKHFEDDAGSASIVTDPIGGSNMVAKTIKSATAGTSAGTTINGDAGFANPLPFTVSATTMSVRVYSPDAGIPVRLKVENKNDPTKTAETEAMTTGVNTWETLVFDFSTVAAGSSPYNPANTFDKASIFFNFGTNGATAGEKIYYWDDVAFGGTAITSYCDTDVTHLGVAAETASAIKLTIANVDAQSMKVTIESTTADPVDDLTVEKSGGSIIGAPVISAIDNSVAGKLSRTLTWTGTPPANIVLNVLWSKMTQDGNSQLIGGGANTTVAFSEDCIATPSPSVSLAGTTWKLAPMAAALGVGPNKGDVSWWSNSAEDVTTRACLFDDTFVFNADGSFNNVQGDETWVEGWQGVSEGCGTPVAPHNGSNAATWSYDATANTVTLNGLGAHLGLAKVVPNAKELTTPSTAPTSLTYPVELASDGNTMTIAVPFTTGDGGSGYWQFVFQKCVDTPTTSPLRQSQERNNQEILFFCD